MVSLDSTVRPRVKSIFPHFSVDGTIQIQICGSTLELADEEAVSSLLALMDGTRTVGEICRELSADHPSISSDDVQGAIQQLDSARLLENASTDVELAEYDRERWTRDRGFLETYATLSTSKYELQESIQGTKVALLGVGGIGSHVLMDLLGLGVRDIRIVDFDKIELSNLNRQVLYRYADIGRRKVEVAAERAREYQPQVQLDAVEMKISSSEDVRAVATDRQVVIAAVDTPKMHIANWVNTGCVRAGAALLAGGVDLQRAIFYTVIPGVTGCVECWRQQTEEEPLSAAINAEMHRVQKTLRPGERFGQDFAAFGGLVTAQTAYLINEFVRLVSGIAEPVAAGRVMEMRFDDLTLREAESWRRRGDCPVCGEARGKAV